MKLKRLPEDFQVEEQIELLRGGPFAYKLTKQSLGTPEAIDAILHRWNLSRGQVAYAGLKDRHALTTQFVTIKGGPRRGLSQTNLRLEYVGQAGRPDSRPRHRGQPVRRCAPRPDRRRTWPSLCGPLAAIAARGMPNYFDDQRFGSLGESGEFIARPWCLGDYERALWLALAEPNVHDDPAEREQKQLLRDHWGHWPAVQGRAGPLAPPQHRHLPGRQAGRLPPGPGPGAAGPAEHLAGRVSEPPVEPAAGRGRAANRPGPSN